MSTLPDGWRLRRPTLDDVPAVLAVVHASDIAALGFTDFTRDEVIEILTAPNTDPALDSWVALDPSGEIVGWALLANGNRGPRDFLDVYTWPERGQPAQRELLALGLRRAKERAVQWGHDPMTVRCGGIASEADWIDALREQGFTFVKRYARMTRPLGGESPPELPAGVAIRTVRPDDQADMREFHRIYDVAFRDTPDYTPHDYDGWREGIDALPTVVWDEWFVAEVDGAPVGVLQSADQGEENEGWVKNLAVLPEHRGRGVGAALLGTAFAAYASKGRERVGLGVDLTNPTRAYKLYEGLGMTVSYEVDLYERTV